MADHAYWQRTLRTYEGHEVTLYTHRTNGFVARVVGRLLGTADPEGPILDVHGERVRIRGWDRLVAVESSESAVMR